MAIDLLEETIVSINEIDSFKMQIYEKSERQEDITQNDLDRLLKDSVDRILLEAQKIKLCNERGIVATGTFFCLIIFRLSCSLKYTVTQIQSNSKALSGLSTNLIVINSRSYSVSTNEDFSQTSNTQLIIGLAGGLILITAMIFAYREYDKQHKHRRLFNDPEMNASTDVTPKNTLDPIQTTSILRINTK